jgi:predicted RNA-binding protein YlqC (UPF0109 family)
MVMKTSVLKHSVVFGGHVQRSSSVDVSDVDANFSVPVQDMEDATPAMCKLIRTIAQSLVDNPESVQVDVVEGQQTTVLELKVAKEDLGKVIGKQGRTAQAIRTLLGAVSNKAKKRAVLEIVE